MAKSIGAKGKAKRKKVSKHMQEAAERRKAAITSAPLAAPTSALGPVKSAKRKGKAGEAAGPDSDLGQGAASSAAAAAAATAAAAAAGRRDAAAGRAYLLAWERHQKACTVHASGGGAGAVAVAAAEAGGWKFNKVTQAWLLQNMYDKDAVDERGFKRMCRYLEGLQGGGRQRALERARDLIESGGSTPTPAQAVPTPGGPTSGSAPKRSKSDHENKHGAAAAPAGEEGGGEDGDGEARSADAQDRTDAKGKEKKKETNNKKKNSLRVCFAEPLGDSDSPSGPGEPTPTARDSGDSHGDGSSGLEPRGDTARPEGHAAAAAAARASTVYDRAVCVAEILA